MISGNERREVNMRGGRRRGEVGGGGERREVGQDRG